MLSSLFPQFFGSGDGKSGLSTGGNPGQLLGGDRERIASASQLSDTPTQQSVSRIAQNAGLIEAQTILLQEESKYKLAEQDAALANLQVRVNHAEQSFQRTKKYKETMAKHGKNILNHDIESNNIQSNLNGYEQAFQSAESRIHL
ncbi:hypothetical protein VF14_31830 [Nostoc linckia z18]|uniref:Uncharacterized protein n=2 Tax=Nostoc linckia TaxID=92942 RepID=A0A9Q6EIC0_NOSLI|nr:hypothetical protein [Nostoc linckia]PHK34615.1 hypothetical protein VF12_23580 [Nostoc linckia z15]PHK41178.1 hypothetical protein VF13_31685 [Nostoc linckia z16]PHJ55786.1 hypothetical protein VF02_35445 [Nostoc linckia z1]PHJ57000.1 hypothetical protein VF05_36465 [Nostoc linckia z3]PHJ58294.1 hypothetical protein VF03_35650 [Nostoc linckia z2]